MRRFALIACTLAAAAAPLAGCGNKEDEVLVAETEGAYLDVGELRYQVQISRQLNPVDVEDRAYLQGIPLRERKLRPGESWFGVFLRVENPSEEPQRATQDIELEDTQDTLYEPVALGPENPFAYRGGTIQPEEVLPANSSVGQQNEAVGGLLVLFKVRTTSFGDRPLELKILSPTVPQTEATLALDV